MKGRRLISLVLLCVLLSVSYITLQARDAEYDAEYRPQIHYTPKANWMNDPNGLVYNEETKEYHMFYQYCQTITEDQSKKYWGHAVSKDLLHWQELPVAIGPDELGAIWSGSCVIDRNNTSGFFDQSTPAGGRMVALFTYAGGDTSKGYEKVGIAYSKDNGLTWQKHDGNPIIGSVDGDLVLFDGGFRDPRVFWYEDDSYASGGVWVMVIAGGKARIFTSENLIDWTYNSTMQTKEGKAIESECPDFFSLTVDNEEKWIYSCAGRSYYIGSFQKNERGNFEFIAESNIQTLFSLPTDMYAAQTFANDPKGRRVAIYWMIDLSSKEANTLNEKVWDGCQSLPMEIKLHKNGDGYRLGLYPIEEMDSLLSNDILLESSMDTINGKYELISNITEEKLYIEMEIEPGSSRYFDIYVHEGGEEKTIIRYSKNASTISIIRKDSGNFDKDNVSTKVTLNNEGNLKLKIYVDTSVIDVFTENGEVVSGLIYPQKSSNGMHIETTNGDSKIRSIKIQRLNSAWDEQYVSENLTTQEPIKSVNNKQQFPVVYIVLLIVIAVLIVGFTVAIGYTIVKKK